MALIFADRVQQTGTANTTVSFTLSGAVTGYQSFAAIGNANTTYYSATDINGNWEVGIGTYTTSGTLLTRNTILSSSNSGNAVTFTSTVNVWCDYSANKTVIQDPTGNINVNNFNRHSIRPSLLLDFANTRQLDPRITFARASTATYYDGKTTAMAEQNLLNYSEQFDNTIWVKTTTTVTANSFTAPDGTVTADTLTANGTNSLVLQSFTASALPYVFSVYLYRKTGTGSIDITVDGTTYATQTITGAWARYNIITTPTSGIKTAGIRLAVSGDEVYVWGAQLEQRSAVTAYIPTTTVPITNYIPALQTAASGVARFDCNPTTNESLGLLIEEQRTNLQTYSSDYTNAIWTKAATTISANTIIAPDGTLTGSKLVENTATSGHEMDGSVVSAGTSSTHSIYAKAGGRNIITVFVFNNAVASYRGAAFNLITGVISNIGIGITAVITPVGNGWYRCSVSVAVTNTGASTPIIKLTLDDGVTTSYTGDGYSGVYLWGDVVEAGAFPTSYIPTVASQATRIADQASMTGVNFSSWYNISQGTLYAEWTQRQLDNNDRYVLQINDNSTNNVLSIRTYAALVAGQIRANNVTSASLTYASIIVNTNIKSSLSYISSNFNLVVSSGTPLSSLSGLVPINTSQMVIGSARAGTIKKLSYYPISLTNAELQGLTS